MITDQITYDFLPNHIEFNNKGDLWLQDNNLTSLSDYIKFNNDGKVRLNNNLLTSLPDGIQFNNNGFIGLYKNPFKSLPDNIDEFYDRLDAETKDYIQKKFPDHWVVNKERFNL